MVKYVKLISMKRSFTSNMKEIEAHYRNQSFILIKMIINFGLIYFMSTNLLVFIIKEVISKWI